MINFLALDPVFIKLGSLEIRWYAIFIITGAVLAYYIARYFFKKDGHNPEIMENLFFIAFPSGIVGARLWYVLSSLGEFAGDRWYHAFFMWEGGLAIQGGVIVGAAAGIIYLLTRHKEIKIRYALDIILPNILIAQALGRWGNFFNQEVYGACVPKGDLSFLPNFILEQMSVCGISSKVAQPLFLYESLLNILGFVLISIVLRKYLKKRPLGLLGGLYLVWYGTVRAILEPLRDPRYIMEINGVSSSVVMSILFIIAGIGLITYFFIIDKKNKNLKEEQQ